MKRRKPRKRNRAHRNDTKSKALFMIMIICCSVIAGYFTATYLIGPALGLETETTITDFIGDLKEPEEAESDKQNEKTEENKQLDVVQDQVVDECGFALQYGSFSSKEGAESCARDLKESGIKAGIIEINGMYKVIGEIFGTKQEAEEQKNKEDAEDVFITEIK